MTLDASKLGHVRGAGPAECGERRREPLGLGDELAGEPEVVGVALQALLVEPVGPAQVPRGERELAGVVVDRRMLDLAAVLETPREGHGAVRRLGGVLGEVGRDAPAVVRPGRRGR